MKVYADASLKLLIFINVHIETSGLVSLIGTFIVDLKPIKLVRYKAIKLIFILSFQGIGVTVDSGD